MYGFDMFSLLFIYLDKLFYFKSSIEIIQLGQLFHNNNADS